MGEPDNGHSEEEGWNWRSLEQNTHEAGDEPAMLKEGTAT